MILAQEPPCRQVAGHVGDEEGDGLARAVRQRPRRQGEIVESGPRDVLPFERPPAAAEADAQAGNGRGKRVGHGQAGKQMSAGAAPGKNNMDVSLHGAESPLMFVEGLSSQRPPLPLRQGNDGLVGIVIPPLSALWRSKDTCSSSGH